MEKACQAMCYKDKNELLLQLNMVDLGVGQAYHAARLEGALAQLGERHNGIVEVSGSIPLGSTIYQVLIRSRSTMVCVSPSDWTH